MGDKILQMLPILKELETKAALKKAALAHKALAELKGVITSIPNQNILLETLTLREAKESSAIENIISTMDEVYQSNLLGNQFASANAKEVHQYAAALKKGFERVRDTSLMTNNIILEIQEIVEQNNAGFRKLPGTKLLNDKTDSVVYTPPQDLSRIISLMNNLEEYINRDEMQDIDVLIKMAVIHHQFESIHPFYDGNGRTGRIMNILYLVQKKLLDLPVLYMSSYIIKHKQEYYALLQKVRDTNEWEEWVLFMLNTIEVTANESIILIVEIKKLMQLYKTTIRTHLAKIYSQDLLNSLFKYPYTRIEFLERDLQISKRTAMRYLDQLQQLLLVKKIKVGKNNYYFNQQYVKLLSGIK